MENVHNEARFRVFWNSDPIHAYGRIFCTYRAARLALETEERIYPKESFSLYWYVPSHVRSCRKHGQERHYGEGPTGYTPLTGIGNDIAGLRYEPAEPALREVCAKETT